MYIKCERKSLCPFEYGAAPQKMADDVNQQHPVRRKRNKPKKCYKWIPWNEISPIPEPKSSNAPATPSQLNWINHHLSI
jgi:hypothetical protein